MATQSSQLRGLRVASAGLVALVFNMRAKFAEFNPLSPFAAIGNWTPSFLSNRWFNILTASIAVLGFPIVLLISARTTLNQAATIDPYVYAAYIHDYSDTLARFGPTYYSTRVAYIFLEKMFLQLFGLEPGYFVMRFAALAAAAGSAYAISVRFFSRSVAILACAWLCLVPWLAHSLLWTHYDGVATIFLLVGIALSLVPKQWRTSGEFAAGAMFALAVNCNFVVAGIVAVFVPAWIYIHHRLGFGRIYRDVLTVAGGFVLTYLCLIVAMRIMYPQFGWFFESITIKFTFSMVSGVAANWYVPINKLIESRQFFYLLIPVGYAAVIGTFALEKVYASRDETFIGRERSDFIVGAALFLFGIIGLVLALHVGIKFAWLGLFYYNIYFVPACLLALIGIAGTAEARIGSSNFRVVSLCNIIVICGVWFWTPVLPNFGEMEFWIAILVFFLAVLSFRRQSAATAAALVTGSVILTFSLYASNYYLYLTPMSKPFRLHAQASSDQQVANQTEWDIYRGAIFLQKFVNENVSPNQKVGFWYRSDDHLASLDSVQSIFLWGYTRLAPPMPIVDQAFKKAAYAFPFIVLLARTTNEIETGLIALRAAGFSYREIARDSFHGQVWGYTAALGALKPPERILGPLLFNKPLKELKATNGGTVTPTSDGVELETAIPQWAYSQTERLLPDRQSAKGRAVVRVRLLMKQGVIGISVSSVGNISDLIKEIIVNASEYPQVVDIDIPDVSNADLLIFRNASPSGASRAVIQAIDVYRPD